MIATVHSIWHYRNQNSALMPLRVDIYRHSSFQNSNGIQMKNIKERYVCCSSSRAKAKFKGNTWGNYKLYQVTYRPECAWQPHVTRSSSVHLSFLPWLNPFDINTAEDRSKFKLYIYKRNCSSRSITQTSSHLSSNSYGRQRGLRGYCITYNWK